MWMVCIPTTLLKHQTKFLHMYLKDLKWNAAVKFKSLTFIERWYQTYKLKKNVSGLGILARQNRAIAVHIVTFQEKLAWH